MKCIQCNSIRFEDHYPPGSAQYATSHRACPECGSTYLRYADGVPLQVMGRDRRECLASGCGWKGIMADLVPESAIPECDRERLGITVRRGFIIQDRQRLLPELPELRAAIRDWCDNPSPKLDNIWIRVRSDLIPAPGNPGGYYLRMNRKSGDQVWSGERLILQLEMDRIRDPQMFLFQNLEWIHTNMVQAICEAWRADRRDGSDSGVLPL